MPTVRATRGGNGRTPASRSDALEFGHFQASRSDRRMVAVGNAHGLHGFLDWVQGLKPLATIVPSLRDFCAWAKIANLQATPLALRHRLPAFHPRLSSAPLRDAPLPRRLSATPDPRPNPSHAGILPCAPFFSRRGAEAQRSRSPLQIQFSLPRFFSSLPRLTDLTSLPRWSSPARDASGREADRSANGPPGNGRWRWARCCPTDRRRSCAR